MKYLPLTLFWVICLAVNSSGQLVSFNFNNPPYLNATAQHANVSVSEFILSDGSITTNKTTGTYFTNEPYIEEGGGWSASDAASAKYFYVTLTTLPGYQFTLTQISLEAYVTSAGPSAMSILFNETEVYNQDMPSSTHQTITKAVAEHQDLTSITIKIAGWDNGSRSTSGGGSFRIDELEVLGTVSEIPAHDTTSSVVLLNQAPTSLSSLLQYPDSINIFDFSLVDSATADAVPTIFDSLVFKKNQYNQLSPWPTFLHRATLSGPDFPNGLSGLIKDSSIVFNTSGQLEIIGGSNNHEDYSLYIQLKEKLNSADGKTLGVSLDTSGIYTNSQGSGVSYSTVTSLSNQLMVQVSATTQQMQINSVPVFTDSAFSIHLMATDIHGNIDVDYNQALTLQAVTNQGQLAPQNPVSGFFNQGAFTSNALTFSGADTVVFSASSGSLESVQSDTLLVGHHYFSDSFNDAQLHQWTNTDHWTVDNSNNQLKHNLADVDGSSYISSVYPKAEMNYGKMVWRLTLKNGDFNPSSSNSFYYYLMASEPNLLSDSIYGYAVGVNLSGSTDSLSLWRIDSTGETSLLLQSDVVWAENDSAYIEVTRTARGYWQLGYSQYSNYSGVNFTDALADSKFKNLPNHGLVFNYSSTRAGQLWCDNLVFFRLNSPPFLQNVSALSGDTVMLSFSEPLDQASAVQATNYEISSPDDDEIAITNVVYTATEPESVYLVLNGLHTAQYQVNANNISDNEGYVTLSDSSFFENQVPAQQGDVVFNEVLFDNYPPVALPEHDYIELFNRSTHPFYLTDWKIWVDDEVFYFADTVILPSEHVILTSTEGVGDYQSYGKSFEVINSSTLTNTGKTLVLKSAEGIVVDSISYNKNWYGDENKEDGGWSLERIDPENLCAAANNWTASTNESGGTPGAQNDVFAQNPDTLAPAIISSSFLSQSAIALQFSEELDPVTATDTNHWLFSPALAIDSLTIGENRQTVNVYAVEDYAENTTYQLQISNVTDLCGNALDTTISLLYHPAAAFDVVINEVMADPEPTVGLPAQEYLELYNRSNFNINLKDWELWIGGTRKLLNQQTLLPNEYLIVCPEDAATEFEEFGQSAAILSSSLLSNSGTAVVLKDTSGWVVDSISYTKDWYGDENKEDGGWSLERIDPENLCAAANNWTASTNESCGTPGAQNAVFAQNSDTLAPAIISSSFLSQSAISVQFSEELAPGTATDTNHWLFSPALAIDSLTIDENRQRVNVYGGEDFAENTTYQLQISNITDLCGNALDTTISLLYHPAAAFDVVINEVMADPEPTVGLPDQEYLELYNRSNFNINLKDWELWIGGTRKLLNQQTLLPNEYLIVCPEDAEAEFEAYGTTAAILSSSLLSNSGTAVVLKDTSGLVVDSISYTKNWYGDENKEDGGWSLERIDPDNLCAAANNWTASTNESGGTPGAQNAVFAQNPDTLDPAIISSSFLSQSAISVQFSEELTPGTATDTNRWLFSPALAIDSLTIDENRQRVNVYGGEDFAENTTYQLQISNITDLCGNALDTTISLLYHPAAAFDVVINEVMADPEPTVGLPTQEYLELYNRSNFNINLKDWELWIGGTRKLINQQTLLPSEYLIVCPEDAEAEFEGFGQTAAILSSSLLSNSGTMVVLKDTSGLVVDSISYTKNWYGDENKEDGGWSLERIDPENLCAATNNWTASTHESGGTPGAQNAVFAQNPDTLAPVIISSSFLSQSAISVQFYEELDLVTATDTNRWMFSPALAIDSLTLSENRQSINIYGDEEFAENITYQLMVEDVADLCGNALDTTISLLYHPAAAFDVVINEVMADPEPTVGLPTQEYLELYNRSNFELHLQDWELWIGGTRKLLDNQNILPGQYLIVCPEEAETEFEGFGTTAAILSSSLLSNSGTSVVLKDTSGLVVDSISYTKNWYGDENKEGGGWSLERIDPENLCAAANNWTASSHENGGTPGAQNAVYAQNPDTLAPVIISSSFLSQSALSVQFSEELDPVTATDTNRWMFSPALPIDSLTIGENRQTVNVYAVEDIAENTAYQLQVNGITDLCGNALDTTISLLFHPATAYDVVINEVMADPEPTVGLPAQEYLELFNRSNFELHLQDWELWIGGTRKLLDLQTLLPGEYLIVCPEDAEAEFEGFGQTAAILSSSLLSNSGTAVVLKDTSGWVVDSISYTKNWYGDENKEDGGWSLERIDPENLCAAANNWTASAHENGGTPGAQNAVYAQNPDTLDPAIISSSFLSQSAISVQFSEELTPGTATDTNHWLFSPALAIDSLTIDENRQRVNVYGGEDFAENTTYQLQISNITDLCGNALDTTISLLYHPAAAFDVVINEVMADPEPTVGLPTQEYLELYNRSNFSINPKDWELWIGGTRKLLDNQNILPGQYLIVCPEEAETEFEGFGTTAAILSSSLLSNSGTSVVLKDTSGLVVDSISYTKNWYGDENKEDGGWSLERIDPENLCAAANNWTASAHENGGTPGVQNAVYAQNPDTLAPVITSSSFLSQSAISVQFSEELAPGTATDTNRWMFSPALAIDSLTLSENRQSINIYGDEGFAENITYQLMVEDVADLCGNGLDTTIPLLYHPAAAYDLVITEVMADPVPTVRLPAQEYLELFNRSNFELHLQDWELWIGGTRKLLDHQDLSPGQYLIVCPEDAATEFEGFGQTAAILSSSLLSNSGTVVVLKDTSGLVVDSISYTKNWYDNVNKEDGGWSLERIDPDNLCAATNNWTASTHESGGTPGAQNAVFAQNPDTLAPVIISSSFLSQSAISVQFSEELDPVTATDTNRWMFSPALAIDSLTIDENRQRVNVYGGEDFAENTTYQLQISNITDLCGNALDTTISLLYHPAAAFDVVINEVMADPEPTVGLPAQEYLELYNRSNFNINLKDWELWIGGTRKLLNQQTLLPNEYLIVCPEDAATEFEGFGQTAAILSSSLLSNTGTAVVLKDTSGWVVDSISYTKDWYGDENKEDGGWSLERIDPDNLCAAANNWTASAHESGGTPGAQNAVFAQNPDTLAPAIVSSSFLSQSAISVQFSEELAPGTATDTNHWLFSPALAIDSLTLSENRQRVNVYGSEGFAENTTYQLQVNGISDLCGNTLDTALNLLFHPAAAFDVVVNEVMADPEPTVGMPAQEYLELYNRSNFNINLKDWELWISGTRKLLDNQNILPGQYLIVCPQEAETEFEGFGTTAAILSSSLLSNSGTSVVLKDTSGWVVDSISYTKNWYGDENKEDGGWSLERIDPDNFCAAANNWTASAHVSGGTPGAQNAVFAQNPDTLAPAIITSSFLSQSAISVQFSEELAPGTATDTNRWMFSPALAIDSLTLSENRQSINIYGDEGFAENITYQLMVEDVADLCGNALDTTIPLLYHPAAAYDLVINEVMADPEPTVGLPAQEYLELFNRSNFELHLQDWELWIGGTRKLINQQTLLPSEYLIVCPEDAATEFEGFGQTAAILSSSLLSNSGTAVVLKDTSGLVVDSISYTKNWYGNVNKEDGGWSLERIDPDNLCAAANNWTASAHESGGTPGAQNAVFAQNPDTLAPAIVSSSFLSQSAISVQFSEELAPGTATDTNHWLFSPALAIDSLTLSENRQRVNGYGSEGFAENTTYQLQVNGISDLCGNTLDTALNLLFHPAAAFDVVINEVMADPEPTVGLPTQEYLELYNRSNFNINLKDWELWIGGTRKLLDNQNILPGQYLIVCPQEAEAEFEGFGTTAAILSSSLLSNSGTSVVLKDTSGWVVDSISYTKNWYGDENKEDGGWSLERIDPDNFCAAANNWTASAHENGGTPGAQNTMFAVNPDVTAPEILDFTIKNTHQIQLMWSEELKNVTDQKFIFVPEIGVDSIVYTPAVFSMVDVFVSQPIEVNTAYQLRVADISDRCGNILEDTLIDLHVFNAALNELVINELMVDPSPTIGLPEYEYIEIFNRSEKIFQLKNWLLEVGNSLDRLPNYVLNPGSYLVLTSEEAMEFMDETVPAISVKGFPALPNTKGEVALFDTDTTLICRTNYDNSWYQHPEKDDGGWALEKIDPENTCGRINNWKASIANKGGTPGFRNSVMAPNIDSIPIMVTSVFPVASNFVQIKFSEWPDESSVLDKQNIDMQGFDIASVELTEEGALNIIFNQMMKSGENYSLALRNIVDYCGNVIRDTTLNITFYTGNVYDVVINEIMANPEPSIGLPPVEYIELYNRSGYEIDLKNWRFEVGAGDALLNEYRLLPGDYLLLINTEDSAAFNTLNNVLWVDKLRNLPLSGELYLYNSQNQVICATPYDNQWITDDFKANGGYSLERIDYNNPTETLENWQVSAHSEGGTPGKKNSVYKNNPDVEWPRLVRAFAVNEKEVMLTFSERMNFTHLKVDDFTLQPVVDVKTTNAEPKEGNTLTLFLESKLSPLSIYTVKVSEDVTDVAGNSLGENEAQFALTQPVEPSDLLINEVLFDPNTPGAEFIELYNYSSKPLNMQALLLAQRNEYGEIKHPEKVSEKGVVLLPQNFMAVTENPEAVLSDYWTEDESTLLQVDGLISLPNDNGQIVLMDTTGVVIDEFQYDENMHFALLNDTKGVSLERISYAAATENTTNWHSASATSGGATPGYKNSMFRESGPVDETIQVGPESFSPDNDGYHDVLYIDYKLDEPGWVANVTILDAQGRFVKKVTENQMLETSGKFQWQGLDDNQQKPGMGIYIVVVELFDLEGNQKVYKKPCVLSVRF